MATRTPKAPPLSAYLCFAHATRLKLVEEAKAQARADGDGPGQGGSSFSSAIERQLGKAWKELGVEEKKTWENQAVDNRDRYTEECRAAGVEPKAFPHALLLPNRPDRLYAAAAAEDAHPGSATAAAAGGNYGAARAPAASSARRRPARPPDKDGVAYRWDAKSRSWVATGDAARPVAAEVWEPPLAVSAVAEATADPASFTS